MVSAYYLFRIKKLISILGKFLPHRLLFIECCPRCVSSWYAGSRPESICRFFCSLDINIKRWCFLWEPFYVFLKGFDSIFPVPRSFWVSPRGFRPFPSVVGFRTREFSNILCSHRRLKHQEIAPIDFRSKVAGKWVENMCEERNSYLTSLWFYNFKYLINIMMSKVHS